jgi:thiamine-monophosphate kinase
MQRPSLYAARKSVDEFELIRRYFVRANEDDGVITGIGDDGAVLRANANLDLVTVVDTLVEGVHFPADFDAADIAYRAVAVNLSDIAAMGARPRWMTLALTLSKADEAWLDAFATGLFDAASEHDVVLVGGDTTSGEKTVISVQITGEVGRDAAILRSGASPGDTIYLTGTVGDAAGGLELMSAGQSDGYLQNRFRRPSARVNYGCLLSGVASAAIDVSDGLFGDLSKLLAASNVGAELDLCKLPLSAALQANFDSESQRRLALSGGDDYELCFTSASASLPDAGGLRVTAIGQVTSAAALVCRDENGIVEYDDSGYLHFQ